MIFSEDTNSFYLHAAPAKSFEQLTNGLWLALIGVNEIPPHIALVSDGKYYSLSAHKVDCGTPLERFTNTIGRKHIPTLFIKLTNIIARNEAISVNLSLNTIYRNLKPLSNTENTCLSPIKAFFTEYYSAEFANANYVFELLALAERKGILKEPVSLFYKDTHSNIVTLPKYTMAEIKNKIRSLSSLKNKTTHAAI